MQLKGSPYASNVNNPFVVKIGNQVQNFVLPGNDFTVSMNFINPDKSKDLVIVIPSPTPLKEGGLGLGFMFTELKIITIKENK
jgi:hypothetical protein